AITPHTQGPTVRLVPSHYSHRSLYSPLRRSPVYQAPATMVLAGSGQDRELCDGPLRSRREGWRVRPAAAGNGTESWDQEPSEGQERDATQSVRQPHFGLAESPILVAHKAQDS